jgi:hypothetical protein
MRSARKKNVRTSDLLMRSMFSGTHLIIVNCSKETR